MILVTHTWTFVWIIYTYLTIQATETYNHLVALTVRKLEKTGLPRITSTATPCFPSIRIEHIVMFLGERKLTLKSKA